VNSVITITGIGDHLQPEWLITFTGIRSAGDGNHQTEAVVRRRNDAVGQVDQLCYPP
jgi:hypothetical protein